MKKRLLFFIGGLNFGGMERVVFIAYELLKDMYDIQIVTLYQTEKDYDISIPIYDLNVPPSNGKMRKLFSFFVRWIRTKKMKKELKPDIVFSFGMYSNYLNALSKKQEIICTSIRSYDWLTKPFVSNSLDAYIMKRFDRMFSVSRQIEDNIERYWHLPCNKKRVIYNPYDIELINNLAKEKVEDFYFDEKDFYIISAGRLAEQKAFNHLVKAIYLCKKYVPNVKLIILGNGLLKNRIEKLIIDLKLENNVFLLGGKKNPYKYMKQSNVYVLSSLSEGFPNALVEAMALEVPVIAADCPSGPKEILCTKYFDQPISENCVVDYGILVPPMSESNNYESEYIEDCDYNLANAIVYSYNNYEMSKIKAKNAIKRVENFDYKKFKDQLVEFLN